MRQLTIQYGEKEIIKNLNWRINKRERWALTITISGREYISTQAKKNHARMNELIDFFRAQSFIDNLVSILSSGQLQMLLLLKFFLHDKELLLLDEPFQFLDPNHHEKTNHYMDQYLSRDITLVMITHNENDVREWTQLRKEL